jgi:hypothetical protein
VLPAVEQRHLIIGKRPGVLLRNLEQMTRAISDIDHLSEQATDSPGHHRLLELPSAKGHGIGLSSRRAVRQSAVCELVFMRMRA